MSLALQIRQLARTAPVWRAGGKPSTWFPPGGLVEQSYKKQRMHADTEVNPKCGPAPPSTNQHQADQAKPHRCKHTFQRKDEQTHQLACLTFGCLSVCLSPLPLYLSVCLPVCLLICLFYRSCLSSLSRLVGLFRLICLVYLVRLGVFVCLICVDLS